MVGAGKKKPGYDVGFEIPGIRLPDDLKYLKGTLIPPSGGEEPIELKAGPNNTIVVSFVPKEAGKHLIHIKRNGKDVGDSPYVVIVKPEDVALGKPDASKVKCYGPGMFYFFLLLMFTNMILCQKYFKYFPFQKDLIWTRTQFFFVILLDFLMSVFSCLF